MVNTVDVRNYMGGKKKVGTQTGHELAQSIYED